MVFLKTMDPGLEKRLVGYMHFLLLEGVGFISQHPRGSSHPFVTSAPGHPMPSSNFLLYLAHIQRTHTQAKHSYT